MKLSEQEYDRVKGWILRNGRPLEAARLAYHFNGGDPQAVWRLLALYQNPDGGFGHALEPDGWNPASSPYTTFIALGLMRETGLSDPSHPLCQGALRYLASGDSFEDGLWLFSIPSNDAYPHAPWWSYSPQINAAESLGLSAMLSAFLLEAAPTQSPLRETAMDIARRMFHHLMQGGQPGEMGVGSCAALRPYWEALGICDDIAAVDARLSALVNAAIVRDPARWEEYVARPSAAIATPESPFYPGNEADVERELDYLVQTLPKDDVWPINWSWFDLQTTYADAFAVSRTWWKASKAIDKLLFLRAFGWVEAL